MSFLSLKKKKLCQSCFLSQVPTRQKPEGGTSKQGCHTAPALPSFLNFSSGVPNACTYSTAAVCGSTPTPLLRLGRHAPLKTRKAGTRFYFTISRSKIENESNTHKLWSPVTSASCHLYLHLQCGDPPTMNQVCLFSFPRYIAYKGKVRMAVTFWLNI